VWTAFAQGLRFAPPPAYYLFSPNGFDAQQSMGKVRHTANIRWKKCNDLLIFVEKM
jgi:hypothetical protein